MLIGAEPVGRPSLGQIRFGAAGITPVLGDNTQEQPQLRGRIDYQRRIALIASGETRGGILPIIPDYGWFAPLSIPTTRPKLPAYQQHTFIYGNFNPLVSFGWFEPLSEPKRFKQGLRADLQKVTNEQDTQYTPRPNALFGSWYPQLSIPVRIKLGLNSGLQQTWTGPARLLPNPNVTATMSAFEVNADQALMAIQVFPYNPPAGATVSIVEVGTAGSATSVAED